MEQDSAFRELVSPLEQRRLKYVRRKDSYGNRSEQVMMMMILMMMMMMMILLMMMMMTMMMTMMIMIMMMMMMLLRVMMMMMMMINDGSKGSCDITIPTIIDDGKADAIHRNDPLSQVFLSDDGSACHSCCSGRGGVLSWTTDGSRRRRV